MSMHYARLSPDHLRDALRLNPLPSRGNNLSPARDMTQENGFMRTLTAREARTHLYRLMDRLAESHQPILITGKRTNAVLLSAEDWDAIQETLRLLSIPGMRESIKEGMAESVAECAKELDG